MQRPNWHQYFMKMAYLVSERSTCLRRKVGAIVVRNNQVISTGYNGAPKHLQHCRATGCLRKNMKIESGQRHELCRGVHAEQNAIIQAAVNGTSLKQAELYCTHQPCSICSKMIINAEIDQIFIAETYPDKLAEQFLTEAGINVYLLKIDNGHPEKLF